jgi:hypothetical protein
MSYRIFKISNNKKISKPPAFNRYPFFAQVQQSFIWKNFIDENSVLFYE